MFEFVRNHNKWMFLGLLVLILPAFVLFGVQGYSRFTDGANATVAKVGGQSITQAEWDASHREQVQRMRAQMPNLDAALLDSPQARAQTLDALMRQRVIAAAVTDWRIGVPDNRLERLFKTDPQFESLRNPDGSVNATVLASQGMSSRQFAERLRADLAMQQVDAGLTASAFLPKAVGQSAVDTLLQRRTARVQMFQAQDRRAEVKPSDAELEAYYKAHESDFKAPEQATIEYVVLDLAALTDRSAIAEADLRKYYDQNIARYTTAEKRRARHILIQAAKDAPKADRNKAKAQADKLLDEVRAAPARFAEVAKAQSQDEGSAAQGGDLGFFGRGDMVKPFEDAAYALKPGEISPVIESEFGYHIIQLDAVEGGDRKPFEAVKAEIETEVRQQQAQRRWAEAAEAFSNMVYEQSDSLNPVIERFKLEKRTATVQREPAPGAQGALASAKLLQSVFGDEPLKNKRNTDAVEVAPQTLASARVVSHQPARTRPLDEVRQQVMAAVVEQKAEALTRERGDALVTSLQKDPKAAGTMPAARTISRDQPGDLMPAVVQAVLAADPKALPQAKGVAVPGVGYAVVWVESIEQRPANAATDPRVAAQVAQAWNRAEVEAYEKALAQRFKAEKKVDPLKAAAAAQ